MNAFNVADKQVGSDGISDCELMAHLYPFDPLLIEQVLVKHGKSALSNTEMLRKMQSYWDKHPQNLVKILDRIYDLYFPDLSCSLDPNLQKLRKHILDQSTEINTHSSNLLADRFLAFAGTLGIAPNEWLHAEYVPSPETGMDHIQVHNRNYLRANGFRESRQIILTGRDPRFQREASKFPDTVRRVVGKGRSINSVVDNARKVIEKANKDLWPGLPNFTIDHFRRRTFMYHAQFLSSWEVAAAAGPQLGTPFIATSDRDTQIAPPSSVNPRQIWFRSPRRDTAFLYSAWNNWK